MNYHSKNGGDGNLTLFGKVSQLPTPTLDTSMRKKKYSQGGTSLSFAINELNICPPNGGEKNRLSPLFVEWMMGFPTLWTDLEV
jgi:hypothetical protein